MPFDLRPSPDSSRLADLPGDADLATIGVSWSDDGCLLEISGRATPALLDHARDLVYAQTHPQKRLTVRLHRAVVTREVLAMLFAARRYLQRTGQTLVVENRDGELPAALATALAADERT